MTNRAETGARAVKVAQHILILFHDFSAGGTEITALRLAGEWVKAGRRVTILCGTLDGPLWDQVPKGVGVATLSPEIGRSLFSRLKLRLALPDAIDRIAPDIVFLPGNFHLVLAGAVRKTRASPPVVAKVSNPLSPPGWLGLGCWLTNLAFRAAAHETDWLVANSSGLLNDTKRTTGNDRASVIFDPNLDEKAPPTQTSPQIAAGDRLNLLSAGRLVAQKDFALAIRVVAELAKARDVHLTILGEGPNRWSLEKLAARLGIADRVAMPGHARSIVPALGQSHALLLTSRYEGAPAVAVEALEQGVPVIATDCCDFLHDLLGAPGCGILVESRDARTLAKAVETLLAEPRLPAPNTDAFRTNVAAANYLNLFDRLLAQRQRASDQRQSRIVQPLVCA